MRITYQVERFPELREEMEPLVRLQWEDIALDRDSIPFDPDYLRYAALDANGSLHICTVRDDGKLVGWYTNVIGPHLHYKSTLFAFLDQFYLLPEYRNGSTGIKLFQFMEEQVKALGVKEMVSISKNHHSTQVLFDFLGWRNTGITYTRLIGNS